MSSLLSSTELPPLEFHPDGGVDMQPYRMPTAKIGWLHAEADKAGAKFDLIIKDGLGREMLRKIGCGNETEKYGELVNLPTLVGQDIEVSIENLKGATKVKVFLN